jgi:hypothetical protein
VNARFSCCMFREDAEERTSGLRAMHRIEKYSRKNPRTRALLCGLYSRHPKQSEPQLDRLAMELNESSSYGFTRAFVET